MGYATVEDLKMVKVPAVDVTVGELTFKIGAITRAQLKWAMDEVGYEKTEDGEATLADAEAADLLMLAICIVEPPLDEHDDDHLELLRNLPIGHVKTLTDQMMLISGLREEDPT